MAIIASKCRMSCRWRRGRAATIVPHLVNTLISLAIIPLYGVIATHIDTLLHDVLVCMQEVTLFDRSARVVCRWLLLLAMAQKAFRCDCLKDIKTASCRPNTWFLDITQERLDNKKGIPCAHSRCATKGCVNLPLYCHNPDPTKDVWLCCVCYDIFCMEMCPIGNYR